jgi:hypothetical protein
VFANKANKNSQQLAMPEYETRPHSQTPLFLFIRSFHWHVQNSTIPCRSQELLPFLCYVLFPATLPHQLFFHPLSPHLAIYFFVYLSNLVVPKFIYNTLLGILFSSIPHSFYGVM